MKSEFLISKTFKKWMLAITLSLGILSRGNSQSSEVFGSVKGRIYDSAINKGCSHAIVSLLHEDSTLVQFVHTDIDGRWIFTGVVTGNYIVRISTPFFADCSVRLKMIMDSAMDLGTILLSPKSDNLTPVMVLGRLSSIHMKGDTLEFNTGNLKLKPNANVEELLSGLPGVQVDQNGIITVNGKKVQRLLVDGEDLFSGDPTIVTRNLNADMIANIQVLDAKTGLAEFTGIDEGRRSTTVNLNLKNDSKKGYFVKIQGGEGEGSGTGIGGQGYHNENGLFALFKGKQQLAVLGLAANNGITGFGGTDRSMGTGLWLENGSSDALGASAGTGIPAVVAGGVHYADKWNGDANHLVANWQMANSNALPFSSALTEQILPQSIYLQGQQSNSSNYQNQESFTGDYDIVPDSLMAIHFSIGYGSKAGKDQFRSAGFSSYNDTLVNNSIQTINSDFSGQTTSGNIMWRLIGRERKDRCFSIVLRLTNQNDNTSGYVYNLNNFFQSNGITINSDTSDQKKVITTNTNIFNGSLNYVEPVWKNVLLEISYKFTMNSNQSRLDTYNRGDGKYQSFIDTLSYRYRDDVFTHSATLNVHRTGKRFSYLVGGDLVDYANQGIDQVKRSALRYSYINFEPRANATYNLTDSKGLVFNYTTNTTYPSYTQQQNVQNNNDPLHILIGNPNLRPEFSHSFDIGYHNLGALMLNTGLYYNTVENSFSTKIYLDSLSRQIIQTVNTNPSQNAGSYLGLEKRLNSLGITVGLNSNLFFNRSFNFINTVLNKNDNTNYGAGFSIIKSLPNIYTFQIHTNFGYVYSRNSIDLMTVSNFWTQNHSAKLELLPLKTWELNTDLIYSWRQKTEIFTQNNSSLLWDAYINKNFLNNSLSLRCQLNDILGENIGINRSISAGQVSQITSNVIGRYWMLTAIYRFRKAGQGK